MGNFKNKIFEIKISFKMENDNNFPRYLFMLRHAEKVSNITGEKTPNTDITYNGECQASECGMQLSKEISKLE